MAINIKARVLYDFEPQHADELNIKTGDILSVIRQDVGDGWWEGTNSQGVSGLFPEAYVEVVEQGGPPQAPPPPLPPGFDASPVKTPPTNFSPAHAPAYNNPNYSNGHTNVGRNSGDAAAARAARRQSAHQSVSPTHTKPLRRDSLVKSRSESADPPKTKLATLLANLSNENEKKKISRQQTLSGEGLDSSLASSCPVDSMSEDSVPRSRSSDAILDGVRKQDRRSVTPPVGQGRDGGKVPGTRSRADTETSRDSSDHEDEEPPISQNFGTAMSMQTAVSKTGGGTTRMKNLNRFSLFVKSGVEAYILNTTKVTSQPNERHEIVVDSEGRPRWKPAGKGDYTCSVHKPKKESKLKGLKSFIAYQLTPSFNGIEVSRRYKHFDWIYARLCDKFTFIPMPPLPEKQATGRYEEDFVEHRMLLLQVWLDKICRHPVLSTSEVWMHYITTTDDKKWKQGKRKAEKDEFVGGNFFLTVDAPPKPLDPIKTEEEVDQFDRMTRALDMSCKGLFATCSENHKKMTGPFKREYTKLGSAIRQLSQAFELDQSEESKPLTEAVIATSTAYYNVSKLFEEHPKRDLEPMMHSLYSYKGMLNTVPEIITIHKSALQKLKDHEKLSQEGKMSQSEAEVIRSRVDTLSYAMLAEMHHFQDERVIDFKGMMTQFLKEQINLYSMVTDQLQQALESYNDA